MRQLLVYIMVLTSTYLHVAFADEKVCIVSHTVDRAPIFYEAHERIIKKCPEIKKGDLVLYLVGKGKESLSVGGSSFDAAQFCDYENTVTFEISESNDNEHYRGITCKYIGYPRESH